MERHPTRHQLYGHLPPVTKTIQVRRTRHAGHCWRGRDELIRDVLLWTPTHGRAKAGRPARTYIQQQCENTGSCPEDLPRTMNDREEWRERVRDIRATSAIWWWWFFQYLFIILIMNRIKGYRPSFPRLLSMQSSGGYRFNPDCTRVTIQEYLTLVPGYGKRNQNSWPPWIQ